MAAYFDNDDDGAYEDAVANSIEIDVKLPNREVQPNFEVCLKPRDSEQDLTVSQEKTRIFALEGIDNPDQWSMVVLLRNHPTEKQMDDHRFVRYYTDDLTVGLRIEFRKKEISTSNDY